MPATSQVRPAWARTRRQARLQSPWSHQLRLKKEKRKEGNNRGAASTAARISETINYWKPAAEQPWLHSRSVSRGTLEMCPLFASWAQFGSAARGLGTVWKFCVGWAQFGSARFSRAAHNLDAPTSHGLGIIWKCCVSWAQFGSAARGLGLIWKCCAGSGQFGIAGLPEG